MTTTTARSSLMTCLIGHFAAGCHKRRARPRRLRDRMAGGLVFFTGFPGFIGRKLVARLLADAPDRRVAALVEDKMAGDARDCARKIDGGDRIEVLTGDITDRRLGL